jgi:hypothetical protein
MEYLITPPSVTNWKINQADFIESLKQQWSNIELNLISNSEDFYSLEWIINFPNNQRLDGALHQDKQGISLDGDLETCANFAIWFRSLIPENQSLIFYDQGYNFDIQLQKDTQISDFMKICLTTA